MYQHHGSVNNNNGASPNGSPNGPAYNSYGGVQQPQHYPPPAAHTNNGGYQTYGGNPEKPTPSAGGYHGQPHQPQPHEEHFVHGAPVTAAVHDDATFANSSLKPEEVQLGVPLYEGSSDPAARRFIRTGYRDVWALVLFAVVVAISFALAIHNGRGLSDGSIHVSHDSREQLKLMQKWCPAGFAISILVAVCIMTAMRAFARQFIIVANVAVICINVAFALWAFANDHIAMGVIWLIFAIINAVWLYFVRRRIPFAAVLLRTSVTLVMRHWGTLVTSFVCLGLAVCYVGLWLLMGSPVFARISGDDDTLPAWVGYASIGLLLALLWVSQVCTNVSHVTTSGVVATWYFLGEAAMPSSPSAASAKRASTTSLGSICFGSLVVAILKTINAIIRAALQNDNANGLAACILMCVLNIIERLVEYFNVYAFTHVAIYGSSYIEAAKQTWRLVKECGWAAYFNDSLVWPVLSLVTLFPALGLAVAVGLAASSVSVGVALFVVCYVTLVLCMRPVYSGVVTQFVCIAECPDTMQQTNPQYHHDIDEATRCM